MRSGDFSYADFLHEFGVTDEVARVGDLVGGREIYTASLEIAKINTNKMFTLIAFRIWIQKSIVVMSRTKRHCFLFYCNVADSAVGNRAYHTILLER